MPQQPTAWDARNTLYAMRLWADGKCTLEEFIEMCVEIYEPYLLDEMEES